MAFLPKERVPKYPRWSCLEQQPWPRMFLEPYSSGEGKDRPRIKAEAVASRCTNQRGPFSLSSLSQSHGIDVLQMLWPQIPASRGASHPALSCPYFCAHQENPVQNMQIKIIPEVQAAKARNRRSTRKALHCGTGNRIGDVWPLANQRKAAKQG